MHHSESFCPQVVMQIACGAVTFSFLGRDEAVSRASTSSCTGGLAAQASVHPARSGAVGDASDSYPSVRVLDKCGTFQSRSALGAGLRFEVDAATSHA